MMCRDVRCLLQGREASRDQERGTPTSSSSVELLKAFTQLRTKGGGLSAAMDELGEAHEKLGLVDSGRRAVRFG